MLRRFFLIAAILVVGALTLDVRPEPALAQLSISGGGWDGSTDISVTGVMNFPDDTELIFGDSAVTDGGIEFESAFNRMRFRIPNSGIYMLTNQSAQALVSLDSLADTYTWQPSGSSTTGRVVLDSGIAAGEGGTVWTLEEDWSSAVMDGTDTRTGLLVDITDGTSTGSSNTLYGVRLAALTNADANTDEWQLYFEDGWDYTMGLKGTTSIIKFVDAASNLYVQDYGGTNRLSFLTGNTTSWENGNLVVATQGANWNIGGVFLADGAHAAANGSEELAYYAVKSFTDAAHTGTGNDLVAFKLGEITTPDADMTHSIIGAEGGWDYFVWGDAALGTDAWTTATDKTANAKSGTLRVEIAGSIYHIQLYAN